MPHVPGVSAVEISHPVSLVIGMETNDLAQHVIKIRSDTLCEEYIVAKANTAATGASYFLSVLRIVVGALYTQHGLALTFGVLGGHRASITSFSGIGGLIELVGGVLFTLGIFTRVIAFFLSGQMAVAYFHVHAPHGPNPLQNSGELAVLYCFVFLYFVFAGGGALSVDRIRGRA